MQIESTSAASTEQLGVRLGNNLKGNEVIELISDIGGGKTTFVRGLAAGAGSTDKVSSPTFTISKVYRGSTLAIHHYDFYRLVDAGLMKHELIDVLADPTSVIVSEWSGVVDDVLPRDRLRVSIAVTDENSRQINLNCPPNLSYLLEGIC